MGLEKQETGPQDGVDHPRQCESEDPASKALIRKSCQEADDPLQLRLHDMVQLQPSLLAFGDLMVFKPVTEDLLIGALPGYESDAAVVIAL